MAIAFILSVGTLIIAVIRQLRENNIPAKNLNYLNYKDSFWVYLKTATALLVSQLSVSSKENIEVPSIFLKDGYPFLSEYLFSKAPYCPEKTIFCLNQNFQ
jgi:hypothetical protein